MNKRLLLLVLPLVLLAVLGLYSCSKEPVNDQNNDPAFAKADLLEGAAEESLNSDYFPLAAPEGSVGNTVYTDADVVPVDGIWVHYENGPYRTLYRPDKWNHVDEGPATTAYTFPEPTKHATEGLDKTIMFPEDFVHITEGPRKSRMGPPGWTHITVGNNKSKYKWDGHLHIDAGSNKTLFKRL
ncbi:MAG: hypothetical protein JNM68_10955 [Dinghuibacter sp.]|nr:hypothetical protein [Dinghuibacter sp.]